MRRLAWLCFILPAAVSAVACAQGTAQQQDDCGNGAVESGEACDDGNRVPGDGCSAGCSIESGWSCLGAPSVCTASSCGNGHLDSGEECEGTNLGGQSCQLLGFDGGILVCDPVTCRLDTADCTGTSANCGNGAVDPGEECDGANHDNRSCASFGFDGGMLSCAVDCTLDTSLCTLASCGNGTIDAGEACDDANTFPGDGCSPNCSVEAGWTCTGQPSTCTEACGNGTIDAGEDCDGFELGGQTCTGLGFDSGTLACNLDCTFDTGTCELGVCGDGVADVPVEQCDGVDLAGQDCVGQGFSSGTLACTAGCTFDTSGCIIGGVCGDGNVDPPEECDTTNLNGQDCVSQGFASGTLACSATCIFDTAGCSVGTCGNSVVESGESCDDGNTSGGDGCDASCQWENTCSGQETIGCGDTDYDDALGVSNDISNYNATCSNWSGSSSDRIYTFTPTASQSVTVGLSVDIDDDFDLFVIEGGCHSNLCIDFSSSGGTWDSVTFNATAGLTYYIVVEFFSWWSTWGDYDLSVSCN